MINERFWRAREIEAAAASAGVEVAQMLHRIRMLPSVFERWKNGQQYPTIAQYAQLCAMVGLELTFNIPVTRGSANGAGDAVPIAAWR
jgi:hypothetical protein